MPNVNEGMSGTAGREAGRGRQAEAGGRMDGHTAARARVALSLLVLLALSPSSPDNLPACPEAARASISKPIISGSNVADNHRDGTSPSIRNKPE
jgi:hypothetical protein